MIDCTRVVGELCNCYALWHKYTKTIQVIDRNVGFVRRSLYLPQRGKTLKKVVLLTVKRAYTAAKQVQVAFLFLFAY